MAGHGRKRHLKRLAAPKLLPLARKNARYLRGPIAGRHKKSESMSLLVLLRDVLHLVQDRSEGKKAISSGLIKIDGKVVVEESLAVGLMDVISIPSQGVHYRIVISHGKLTPVAISEKEAAVK